MTICSVPNYCQSVSPSARRSQLWRRTGNFLKTVLQFYVYDLRFKAAGLTTFLIEFWTLLYASLNMSGEKSSKGCPFGKALVRAESIDLDTVHYAVRPRVYFTKDLEQPELVYQCILSIDKLLLNLITLKCCTCCCGMCRMLIWLNHCKFKYRELYFSRIPS